jgi:hypothetical protein
MDIHPSTYHRWRKLLLAYGPDTLQPRERRGAVRIIPVPYSAVITPACDRSDPAQVDAGEAQHDDVAITGICWGFPANLVAETNPPRSQWAMYHPQGGWVSQGESHDQTAGRGSPRSLRCSRSHSASLRLRQRTRGTDVSISGCWTRTRTTSRTTRSSTSAPRVLPSATISSWVRIRFLLPTGRDKLVWLREIVWSSTSTRRRSPLHWSATLRSHWTVGAH